MLLQEQVFPAERLDVMGSIVTFRATPADTNGTCLAFDLEAAPGVGVPLHVHVHEDELFIVRRGAIRFIVNGDEIVVRAGESLFAPRDVPHEWWAIGDEVAHANVIVLPGKLDDMFRDLAALPAGVHPSHAVEICGRHGVRFL